MGELKCSNILRMLRFIVSRGFTVAEQDLLSVRLKGM